MIMRRIEGYPGIKEEGHSVNNIWYIDDTVLNEETLDDLQ